MPNCLTRTCLVGAALLVLTGLHMAAAGDPNNPTGTAGLMLIDKRGSHIRFVDPKTYKEISSFATDKAPHDLVISPDHTTAYVPIYGDGIYNNNPHPGQKILIVDLKSRSVTGEIDISPYQAPHGIQIDDRGRLYVVCDISRKLLIIDTKTRKIEDVIDVDGTGHWIAVLPNLSKAYVTNQNDRPFIGVVDLKTKRLVGRIPAPNGTRGVVATPDGTRVFAMDLKEPEVIVINPATDQVIERIRLQGHDQPGYKLRVSPDGRTLIVCGYLPGNNSFVNVLKVADLHGRQHVLTAGKNAMGFAFAPDNRTAVVLNDGDGTVTVVDVQDGRVTHSFQAGTGIESASYF
jgi:YVTN family beta-propeller protein